MNMDDTAPNDLAPVVLHHADLPIARLPGIEHRTLAGHEHGLRQICVWEQTLAPAAATPPHRHDSEEIVICHGGHGELRMENRVHRFGPATSVIVPRNLPHQIFNTGDEPLRITAVFSASRVEVFDADDLPLALPW